MFWADRIVGEITARFEKDIKAGKPIIIRDEKTLSGRVHIGSMRGVAIHSVIHEILSEQKIASVFRYELNDFDPMDGFPVYLPEEFKQYLGKQLMDIPSPEPSASNFAEYFANDFTDAIAHGGFLPEYYRAHELYLTGKMDGVIREALLAADTIRKLYKDISGSVKKEGWLPVHAVCPQCKKIVTTISTDFDGETILVNCYKTAVEYTQGCGFEGRVSPFGGNAKLTWKVEWAAKWKVNGVMVEGAGKDHSTKGGSRDVANHISREVFNYEPPFDVPYEFLLVGGKKMSSSKGRGSSAHEIADLVPPKIFRLALLGKDINQQINFDPEGDTIPVLYDQYDKLADGYKTVKDDDYARLFTLIHASEVAGQNGLASHASAKGHEHDEENRGPFGKQLPTDVFLPRFSQVAFIVQMPHLNLEEEVAALKGSPLTDADKAELHERALYAKRWLSTYAPEKFVFTLQEQVPDVAKNLSDVQKGALQNLLQFIESAPAMPSGEDMHAKLHALKEEVPIAPAELFSALYLAFLGKGYGPKAGWFLSVLDKGFVVQRLKEVTA